MATAEDYDKMSDSEKKKEDWMNSKWRPMMGWLYMVVCAFDFVLFPIMYAVMTTLMFKGQIPQGFPAQWNPLTLQGAGLFHIAMGAVLGLAAWGRTQEKLNGANNGGLAPVSQSVTTTFGTPQAGGFGNTGNFGSPTVSGGFGLPAAGSNSFGGGGFGGAPSTNTGFGSATGSAQVITGFGGKPAPVQPPQPEL